MRLTSAIGNRFLFTGRVWDAAPELYNYRARYYEPWIGRFYQRDPLGQLPDVNLYRYVGNNPVNLLDPLGLAQCALEKPWWEKLEEGYYYGTGIGQEAVEWYAQRYVETGNRLWAIPGSVAALWTPETYQAVGWTLVGALSAAQSFGAPYRQYYPSGNPQYQSPWLTRGRYEPGPEAQRALQLPKYNPGTAVREVRPNPFEPIAGPQHVEGGTGWEYYRGWRFPDQ